MSFIQATIISSEITKINNEIEKILINAEMTDTRSELPRTFSFVIEDQDIFPARFGDVEILKKIVSQHFSTQSKIQFSVWEQELSYVPPPLPVITTLDSINALLQFGIDKITKL